MRGAEPDPTKPPSPTTPSTPIASRAPTNPNVTKALSSASVIRSHEHLDVKMRCLLRQRNWPFSKYFLKTWQKSPKGGLLVDQ